MQTVLNLIQYIASLVAFIPYYVYLWVAAFLFSFILYDKIRNRVPFGWSKFVLDRTFYLLCLALVLGFTIHIEIISVSFVTFSSVGFGFWLTEKRRQAEERRKLVFFLSAMQDELKYNKTELKNMMDNYHFYLDEMNLFRENYNRYLSFITRVSFLKNSIYESFISSSIVTALRKDETFEAISEAYSSISYLNSTITQIGTDFEFKVRGHEYSMITYGTNKFEKELLENLKEKLERVGRELAVSHRWHTICLREVSSYIASFGIKYTDKGKFDYVLTVKDKEFLNNIFLPIPEDTGRNPFKKSTKKK